MPRTTDQSLAVSQGSLISTPQNLADLEPLQIVLEIQGAVNRFALSNQPRTNSQLVRLKAQLQVEFTNIISQLLQCRLKQPIMARALSCLLQADRTAYYPIFEGPLAEAVSAILDNPDREEVPALLKQVGFLKQLKLYSYLPSSALISILRQILGRNSQDDEASDFPVENGGDYGVDLDTISNSKPKWGSYIPDLRLDSEADINAILEILEERDDEEELTDEDRNALLALLRQFPALQDITSITTNE